MPVRIKVLLIALGAVMIASALYALNNGVSGDESTSNNLPAGVDRLIPASGSTVLSQSTVGIDLADGYDAYLIIDEVEIRSVASKDVEDGMVKVAVQNIVQYTPGPGRAVSALHAPQGCVTAMITNTKSPGASPTPVRWCFTVT